MLFYLYPLSVFLYARGKKKSETKKIKTVKNHTKPKNTHLAQNSPEFYFGTLTCHTTRAQSNDLAILTTAFIIIVSNWVVVARKDSKLMNLPFQVEHPNTTLLPLKFCHHFHELCSFLLFCVSITDLYRSDALFCSLRRTTLQYTVAKIFVVCG